MGVPWRREEVGWREWEGIGVRERRGGRKGWEGGGGRIEGGRGVGRDKAFSNSDLRGGEIEHDVQADDQPEESTDLHEQVNRQ